MLSLVLCAALSAPAPPVQKRLIENDYDRIVLEGGKEVEGRVLYEDDEVVVVRHGTRKEKEYPRVEVAEVRSVERSLREFLTRVDALQDPDDLAALTELATYCADHGLPGEARATWLFVLTRDPENEAAWTALEGRKSSKGWELKDDKRWRTLEDFRAEHSTWKHALELRSSHFVLQSDLSLEESIRALVTLEETYQTFYDALTPALRLYSIDEQVLVQVTKDRGSYPVPPLPRDAWFYVPSNTLNVCVEGTVDTRLIVRELTQGLVYNAFNNTLRKDGQISPWVRRGIAEWFAGGAKKGELRVEIDLDQLDLELFRRQAESVEPLPLQRLLTLAPREFETGPAADLGAAEAYTLLVFLVRGADGKYRKGLHDFMLSSYNGQGSVTHFKKLVAEDLDALETEWTAFVKEKAAG